MFGELGVRTNGLQLFQQRVCVRMCVYAPEGGHLHAMLMILVFWSAEMCTLRRCHIPTASHPKT